MNRRSTGGFGNGSRGSFSFQYERQSACIGTASSRFLYNKRDGEDRVML